MKDGYKNNVLCKKCGGECCKNMPGIAYPSDFDKPISKSIRKALESGFWSIDWWEGDPRPDKDIMSRCYYLRPARKEGQGKVFDPSWGGECIFLNKDGCKLSFNNRPKGCRFLEAGKDKCNSHGHTKSYGAIAWLKYQRLLQDLGNSIQ
jgi:Fe-S-cluster containining protein